MYLPGRLARLPLRLPTRPLNPEELDSRLDSGDRRQGLLLYRPNCATCRACEAIRLDVAEFRPNRSQRRAFQRGEQCLTSEIVAPSATAEKVRLYNEHKQARGLDLGDDLLDLESYQEFLVETCVDTFEINYRHEGTLIAVSLVDRAQNSLSATYTFFDPRYAKLSPGTYSIMKQLSLCRQWGLQHLYLGLYVEGCQPMEYKTLYRPHQRRVGNAWHTIS